MLPSPLIHPLVPYPLRFRCSSPISGFSTTTSSTIRLQANSFDLDGNLDGVRFYINGEALDPSSWNGYLDFSMLTHLRWMASYFVWMMVYRTLLPVIIEFDTDGSTSGCSAPNPVPKYPKSIKRSHSEGSYTAAIYIPIYCRN